MDSNDILDKSYETQAVDLGTIMIRVVVLPRSATADGGTADEDEPMPTDAAQDEISDDDVGGDQKRPIDSYLESSKRGKGSVVFLVNGQRQHQLDNTLIQRDLEFKYLRHRMMVIVDVDGLTPQTLSRLMSGARQSFYQGEVYAALLRRVIDTLKEDPDLVRLEEAAAQAIASLRTGDKAVKDALDKLIHERAPRGRQQAGNKKAGSHARGSSEGPLIQHVDSIVEGRDGTQAEGPTLRVDLESDRLRLPPDTEVALRYQLFPQDVGTISAFQLDVTPPVPDLVIRHEEAGGARMVTLMFPSPTDDSEPHYPIRATLIAIAALETDPTPRVVTTRLNIAPNAERKPREPVPPPVLLDTPTFLRLVTRQPITMIAGGPDVHIKLKWDGKDSLLFGPGAQWNRTVAAQDAVDSAAHASFTRPEGGRFELVLPVPADAKPGTNLSWRVDLVGPSGETLSASFGTVVIEPIAPRQKISTIQGGQEDYEDYEIVFLEREDWHTVQCFDLPHWTAHEAGAFDPPTATAPLMLYINMGYEPVEDFVQEMTRRQLAEMTIAQRKNRYTTHLAYHLYQMFQESRNRARTHGEGDAGADAEFSEAAMRGEVSRVATTLLQLMDRSSN